MENPQNFAGNKKEGMFLLHNFEKKMIDWAVPRIPKWINSVHLTVATFPISVLIMYFGYLAKGNLNWLWGISGLILAQYVTDSLDGSLGRYRNSGLVKWGFYVDHFLDYFFMTSLNVAGFFICPPELRIWIIILGAVLLMFMVNSFLFFGAAEKFDIYHCGAGPSEFRFVVIFINILITYTGTWHFKYTLPFATIACGIGLFVYCFSIHKTLWNVDMENKKKFENEKNSVKKS